MRTILSGCLMAALAVAARAQYTAGAEHPAIAYSTSTPSDAVARLQQRIDAGEVTLDFDAKRGYLPSVLQYLHVPVSSQGLVFSRTSLQVDKIAPWTPRAVYFNDSVYVGWVRNGPVMELSSADPQLGAVFYTLEQQPVEHPRFKRQTNMCLQCHDSASTTGGVPGFILRSVIPDRYGYVISSGPEGATTDRTPIQQRWGGWYVTGTHGDQTHMGNTMAPMLVHEVGNVDSYLAKRAVTHDGNVLDLRGRFDVAPYLSPHSDIVALMVLAHQTYVHNLMTFANYEGRRALYDEQALIRERGGAQGVHLEITTLRVHTAADRLARAMLFSKEAPLTAAIAGVSGFAAEFAARGPRDRMGRSLRDPDLTRRLFRYPLSYLIYSDDFDALPDMVKEDVYRRFADVLTGRDRSEEFIQLSDPDRTAILSILRETKPGFSDWMATRALPGG